MEWSYTTHAGLMGDHMHLQQKARDEDSITVLFSSWVNSGFKFPEVTFLDKLRGLEWSSKSSQDHSNVAFPS